MKKEFLVWVLTTEWHEKPIEVMAVNRAQATDFALLKPGIAKVLSVFWKHDEDAP